MLAHNERFKSVSKLVNHLSYVQCVYIVLAKYQIAPSKAVVVVDWPMKAPSMHIQSPIREKLSKLSHLSFCQKKYF